MINMVLSFLGTENPFHKPLGYCINTFCQIADHLGSIKLFFTYKPYFSDLNYCIRMQIFINSACQSTFKL